MKIGNILARIGIIVAFLGILMLPLYNFNDLLFLSDAGYVKEDGWILIAKSGIFKWPG